MHVTGVAVLVVAALACTLGCRPAGFGATGIDTTGIDATGARDVRLGDARLGGEGGPGAPGPGAPGPGTAQGAATRSPPAARDHPGWVGVVLAATSVEVAANTAGQLKRVLVQAGETVVAGQVLAEVDNTLLRHDTARATAALTAAEADARQAATAARQATARHERRAALVEVLSREALTAAALEVETRLAAVAAARARVDEQRAMVQRLRREMDLTQVRAPSAGVVAVRYLDPGTTVASGTALVRLVSAGPRRIRFAVPVDAVETLTPGSPVRVELGGNGARVAHVAHVVQVAPEVDGAAEQVFVDAVFRTEGIWRDGRRFAQAVNVQLRAGLGVRVRPGTAG